MSSLLQSTAGKAKLLGGRVYEWVSDWVGWWVGEWVNEWVGR